MKKLLLPIALLSCLAFAGCSKDAEIESFITEFETVTQTMTSKIESGDAEGAKKVFDEKKESLKASWDGIKGARGFQVSEESKKKLMASVTKNVTALSGAVMKGAMKGGNANDMKSLLKEYQDIFKM
ncbi:MAG: hypothetical protein HKN25_18075 [Pyrinomonadaceae bacterium]|nr:hypothetical protein [Pyrinomonadaceae bacterium]